MGGGGGKRCLCFAAVVVAYTPSFRTAATSCRCCRLYLVPLLLSLAHHVVQVLRLRPRAIARLAKLRQRLHKRVVVQAHEADERGPLPGHQRDAVLHVQTDATSTGTRFESQQ